MKKLFGFFVFIIISVVARAQTIDSLYSDVRFSVFGGYSFNTHDAGFSELPGVPNCCPTFESGRGGGFYIGAGIEHKLPQNFAAGLGAEFASIGAELKKEEPTLVKVGETVAEGKFEHRLKADLAIIGVRPYLRYYPLDGLNLTLGWETGILIEKNYDQIEEIIEPDGIGIFPDTERRTRNETSGVIDETKTALGSVFFGVRYVLPLNESGSLRANPGISYFLGTSDIVKNLDWRSNSLRAGVEIIYVPQKIEPKPLIPNEEHKIEYSIDTVLVETFEVERSRVELGVQSEKIDRIVTPEKTVIIRKFSRTDTLFSRPAPIVDLSVDTDVVFVSTMFASEVFPILPVVFFKPESDDFREFYDFADNPSDFRTDRIEADPFELHKNVLDIIGNRMRDNKSGKLRLIGYADSTTENSSCDLAFRRAAKVKTYLVEKYKIDTSRIVADSSKGVCAPPNPTKSQSREGYSENMRVEISSDSKVILEPVVFDNFAEIQSDKAPSINIDLTGSTAAGIVKTRIDLLQNGDTISRKTIPNPVREILFTLDDNINNSIVGGSMLDVIVTLTDLEGKYSSSSREIKILKDTAKVEVERISLILFEVNSAEIPAAAADDIRVFLAGIDSNDKIKITGFSDYLGESSANIELSKNRAQNVADLVRGLMPSANIETVQGVGSIFFPPGIDSYSTPPQRFLSRTVYIEVYRDSAP